MDTKIKVGDTVHIKGFPEVIFTVIDFYPLEERMEITAYFAAKADFVTMKVRTAALEIVTKK